MPYAVQQDIIDRYGSDSLYVAFDRDGNGALDTDAVTRSLSDASEEIDTYLIGRYPLPLAATPKILTFICVDIAMYKGSNATAVTEEKRTRYEDAIRLLTKIAKGEISLGLEKPEQGGKGGASFASSERLFTRNALRGM